MKISWTPFWLGIAGLFAVVLYVDYRRYVMPDAVSTSVGTVIGTMAGTWILWRIIKFALPKIAPDARVFVLVCTGLVVVVQLLHLMK